MNINKFISKYINENIRYVYVSAADQCWEHVGH